MTSRYQRRVKIGSILATLVGGFVVAFGGVRIALWISCLFSGLNLILLLKLVNEPERHYQETRASIAKHIAGSFRLIFGRCDLRYYFALNLVVVLYSTVTESFTPLFFLKLVHNPAFMSLFLAATTCAVWLGNWLCRSKNMMETRWAQALAATLFLAMIAMAEKWTVLSGLAFLIQAIFYGAVYDTFRRELNRDLDDSKCSTLLSLYGLSADGLFLGIGLWFGHIANRSVPKAFAIIDGVIVSLVCVITPLRGRFVDAD